MRGQGTSELVQIDHVVPLAVAWRHGAASWTDLQREDFANDPANLLAVEGNQNQAKSDSGVGEWLPPAAAERCAYVETFVSVLVKYRLTIAPADRVAAEGVLAGC